MGGLRQSIDHVIRHASGETIRRELFRREIRYAQSRRSLRPSVHMRLDDRDDHVSQERIHAPAPTTRLDGRGDKGAGNS